MIDKLFYVILYRYTRIRGTQRKIDTPLTTVYIIFSLLGACLLMSAVVAIHSWLNPLSRTMGFPKYGMYIMLFISATVNYWLFIKDKRYLKIYSAYRNDAFLNSKAGKWLSWSIIIFILMSPFVVMLLKNKLVLGHWV